MRRSGFVLAWVIAMSGAMGLAQPAGQPGQRLRSGATPA